MKIYINGQGFGSNLPLQGSVEELPNKYLTAISTSGDYICNIAINYSLTGRNNLGGTLALDYNKFLLLEAGTFKLRMGSSSAEGTVMTGELNAQEFVNQIDTTKSECIVYIPGYLDVIPYTNFVVNNYYTLTQNAKVKIHTDGNWSITDIDESINVSPNTGSAGDFIVDIANLATTSTQITFSVDLNDAVYGSFPITLDKNATTCSVDTANQQISDTGGDIYFTGRVHNPLLEEGIIDENVSYKGTKPSWITDIQTSTVRDSGELVYTIVITVSKNPGDERTFKFNPEYKGFLAPECTLTQEAKTGTAPTGTITVNKPTNFTIPKSETTLDYDWLATGKSEGYTITTKTESSDTWITVSSSQLSSTDEQYTLNPKGTITFESNTTGIRTGTVTLGIYANNNLITSKLLKFTQEGKSGDTITLNPNSVDLDHTAQTKTITISYTGTKTLTVTSNQNWLTVDNVTNAQFNYLVTENTGNSRTAIITVTDGTVTATAQINQAAKGQGSLRVGNSIQSISAAGGTLLNDIITTGNVGTISVSNPSSWCYTSITGKTIYARCSANTGSSRSTTVTVSATNANSVRYTINQAGVAQQFIYFESETKSIGYQGGTIINNLYTNGNTPTYTSTQSWATVSSSGVVTVSSNSSSTSRSATITAANSVGRATYTIYQTGYSTDRPIWKNTIYSETTSSDYVEYHIDSASGTVLYAGKVYKYPNSTSVEFNVNDIISNYLDNMPFPSRDGNTSYNTWKQSFNLVTSTGRSTSYTFYNDWSYEDSLQQINPVSLIVDPNQLFVCSGTNTYFMIGNQQYTVNGTYRLDLSNLVIPCGTEIKVYNNSSLIWTYTVDDLHKDFVIYWANKYGGWDFLPIKGNSIRTDNIESNKYSRIDNYTLYDTKYLNVIKPSWKLYSGWLKGNLADLMGSVDVRLYDLKTKELYKVNITDTQTDYRTYKNSGNRLVSYEINCEMSNNYLRK